MSGSQTLSLRLRSHLNYELLAVALILVLAIVTRLYQLGSFPYFPPQWPWLGDHSASACPAGVSGVWPGLYRDEMSRLCDVASFPHVFTTYEPSLNILFIKASQFTLGFNDFADRLPTAVVSILTILVIYLAAKELYKSKGMALVSGLYFVVMVPAIIYGRMIYYENLVAFFLALVIFSISRYENGKGRKWLYLGALSAALAPFGKVDGAFVSLFFTIWVIEGRGIRKKIAPLVIAWGPIVLAGVAILKLIGTFQGVLQQWYFGVVGRELSFQFLFLQTMPSGYITVDMGYVKPDFWYVFGFICLAALVVTRSRAGRMFTQALFAFVAVFFLSFGISPYYLIMLFPVFALSVGGGVSYLADMGSSGALGLYALLYGPLVVSYIGTTTLPYIGTNYPLFFLKDLIFFAPALAWLALDGVSKFTVKRHFPLATVIIVCFFALLILGTPEIYSYYFLGRAP